MKPSAARIRNQRQRGVTLVELMIAVSLVAIISAGMLIATRTSLLTYEKTEQRLQSDREAMNTADILNRQLHSFMPALAECPSSSGAPASLPLFVGTPTTLIAVSQFSIAQGTHGYPQILEFAVEPSPSGGVRLVVNEIPYTGPSSAAVVCRNNAFLPIEVKPSSFVLADRLASCLFSYHKPIDPRGGLEETGWSPDWIFPTAPPNLPPAIRVDMVPLDARGPEASRRLPVYSVTAPIRIERAFQEQYEP